MDENMMTRISTEKQYTAVMKTVEGLLDKATRAGGFQRLGSKDYALLKDLTRLAETYEDSVLTIMPIRPRTLEEAVELRRKERKLTQVELAKILGIGAPKLSQILSGKRRADVSFLKAVHRKLNIDADFILKCA